MSSIDSRLERVEQARAARKRPRNARSEAEVEARISSIIFAHELSREAYAALSVAEKIVEKQREIAELGEWVEPPGFCVNSALMHGLRRRMLEIDIELLENPDQTIEAIRRQADEAFRFRGKPQPAPVIIDRPVVATVGLPVPDPRPSKPKPRIDKLADYRADPRSVFIEPEAS